MRKSHPRGEFFDQGWGLLKRCEFLIQHELTDDGLFCVNNFSKSIKSMYFHKKMYQFESKEIQRLTRILIVSTDNLHLCNEEKNLFLAQRRALNMIQWQTFRKFLQVILYFRFTISKYLVLCSKFKKKIIDTT